jgi:hypothetical protein
VPLTLEGEGRGTRKGEVNFPEKLRGAAEGDGEFFFAARVFAQAQAGLIGPRAGGCEAEIKQPLFAGAAAVAALFVREREVEMHIGMRGHGARGAFEMADGFVKLAEFFERATEVVARNAVERIDLHGGLKRCARIGELAELVVSHAEIDVGFDPVGREFHDAMIIFNGLRQRVGAVFAIERGLEKFLGRGPGHGVELGGFDGHVERESPLLKKRVERALGTRRDHVNFAAEFDETQFLDGARCRGELSFDELDGAANAAGGNVILGDALKAAEGDQIAKGVELLSPASAGIDEAQTLPVTETARLKS